MSIFLLEDMEEPKVILLVSGKRKSGKDYICEKIKSLLQGKCVILRISGPLKSHYAKTHNLDLSELMSDGPYKEKYREDMIKWSDRVRDENPGYFCKAACDLAPTQPVWIVSDIRRHTDVKWFKENYGEKIKTVRISAKLETRKTRGWAFTEGVDDVKSECDLDNYQSWDLEVNNNSNEEAENAIKQILFLINENDI